MRLADSAIVGPGRLPTMSAPRVMFVCTHNSARSQLAAALWRQRSDVPAASAGTHPAGRVHPGAVAAARRRGIPMRGSRPAHLAGVAHDADLVVAVCDSAHEELLRTTPRLHWSVTDPAEVGTDAAFDRAIDELTDRIDRIAPHVRPA